VSQVVGSGLACRGWSCPLLDRIVLSIHAASSPLLPPFVLDPRNGRDDWRWLVCVLIIVVWDGVGLIGAAHCRSSISWF
jgi:hypothetical protein